MFSLEFFLGDVGGGGGEKLHGKRLQDPIDSIGTLIEIDTDIKHRANTHNEPKFQQTLWWILAWNNWAIGKFIMEWFYWKLLLSDVISQQVKIEEIAFDRVIIS